MSTEEGTNMKMMMIQNVLNSPEKAGKQNSPGMNDTGKFERLVHESQRL